MTNLIEYYRMKNGYDTNSIIFEKVKEEDIKICGYSLKEVIVILQALDLERITEIKFCKENINRYIELYNEEQKKIQKDVLNNMFKNSYLFKESKDEQRNC